METEPERPNFLEPTSNEPSGEAVQPQTVEYVVPPAPPPEIVYVERVREVHLGWHTARMVLALACVAGMLGTFMPWVTMPFGSISGTAGDGWLTLVLFLIAFLFAVRNRRGDSLNGWEQAFCIVAVVGAGAIGLAKILRFNDALMSQQMNDNPFARAMVQTVQIGPGLYLILAAALVSVLAAAVAGTQHRTSNAT